MGNIINFSEFLSHAAAPCAESTFESDYDKRRIETVRDDIENMLEDITQKEELPLTVAMSAGRFAAMRMFQLQGRAETLAFIDQCISTAELCDDLLRQLDEDA
jgi:hypothetical protein